MSASGENPELSDADKLELRHGLARLHGALMRAWTLGMFVPRNPAEDEVVEAIRKTLVMPDKPVEPESATPLGLRVSDPPQDETSPEASSPENLIPLSDEDFLAMFDDLVHRYLSLKAAYDRGMVVATTIEQERQLVELRSLLD